MYPLLDDMFAQSCRMTITVIVKMTRIQLFIETSLIRACKYKIGILDM